VLSSPGIRGYTVFYPSRDFEKALFNDHLAAFAAKRANERVRAHPNIALYHYD
jgi:hypothetical protein